MNIIEWSIIGFYLVFLMFLGWYFKRQNKNVSDYFRSGCKGTWWLVGASTFMASFSAWTFTGAAGVAFEGGWTVIIIFWGNALGFLINFLFLAPWFRQLRAITPPEVIRRRFGAGTQQLYAWVFLPTSLLMASLHLYGLSIFCSAVFGFDVTTVILVVGVIVLFYSSVGGSWGVMSTDFLQSLILFPLTIVIAWLCLRELGGIGGFFETIKAEGLEKDFQVIKEPGAFPNNAFVWGWAIAIVVNNLWTHNTMTAGARYFSVKDGLSARKAALLAFFLTMVGSAVWFIPPMTARMIFEPEVLSMGVSKPAETAYAVVSLQLLPLGMTGLMVVAIFAATMSSMDTGLNRNAAIFTRDVYPAICHLLKLKPKEDSILLRIGQGVSLLFGLVIIGLALYFSQAEGRGIFELMLTTSALLGLPMAIPMLWGLFVKKVPAWSAAFSIVAGLVVSCLSFFSTSLGIEPWSFQKNIFWIMLVGSIAFWSTRIAWGTASDAYRKQVDDFFTCMKTPVDFKKEVGEGTDRSQLKVIGGIACSAGGLILLLMFIPNPLEGRLSILFTGGFVVGVGALLLLASRRVGTD
jgi:SSS family solute:Na+ symporter